MDIATAKTLVSAGLVFAVIAFSLVSLQMGVAHIVRDLKESRRGRAAASR